jgi:hypothetical protein
MDLKSYYRKIRETEQSIVEEYPIVVSRESTDGGKAGALTEVSRTLAARLIVDGSAELAGAEKANALRARQAEEKAKAEQLAEASKLHLTVLPVKELERLQATKKSKE